MGMEGSACWRKKKPRENQHETEGISKRGETRDRIKSSLEEEENVEEKTFSMSPAAQKIAEPDGDGEEDRNVITGNSEAPLSRELCSDAPSSFP